jgi:hypothetical protein
LADPKRSEHLALITGAPIAEDAALLLAVLRDPVWVTASPMYSSSVIATKSSRCRRRSTART